MPRAYFVDRLKLFGQFYCFLLQESRPFLAWIPSVSGKPAAFIFTRVCFTYPDSTMFLSDLLRQSSGWKKYTLKIIKISSKSLVPTYRQTVARENLKPHECFWTWFGISTFGQFVCPTCVVYSCGIHRSRILNSVLYSMKWRPIPWSFRMSVMLRTATTAKHCGHSAGKCLCRGCVPSP